MNVYTMTHVRRTPVRRTCTAYMCHSVNTLLDFVSARLRHRNVTYSHTMKTETRPRRDRDVPKNVSRAPRDRDVQDRGYIPDAYKRELAPALTFVLRCGSEIGKSPGFDIPPGNREISRWAPASGSLSGPRPSTRTRQRVRVRVHASNVSEMLL